MRRLRERCENGKGVAVLQPKPRGLLLPLTAILLVTWSPRAFSFTYPPTPADARAQYTQLRSTLQAKATPPPELLAACDAALRGQVFELRGRLLSSLRTVTSEGAVAYTFLLQTPEGVAVGLRSAEELQGVRLDEPVRVLASLPVTATGQEFTLYGIVTETDLTGRGSPPAPELPPVPGLENTAEETGPPPPPEDPLAVQPEPEPTPTVTPTTALQPQLATADPSVREAVWDGMPATGGAPLHPDLPDVGMTPQQIGMWKEWVGKRNKKFTDLQLELVVRWIIAYSAINGIDHRLSFAMIEAESYFNPVCVSHAGAMGMTQLMPFNLEPYGVENPWNVQQNIRGGITLLAKNLRTHADRPAYEQTILGLAAYNAGPGAVRRHGGVPPFRETQNFVRKVSNRFYELVQAGYP